MQVRGKEMNEKKKPNPRIIIHMIASYCFNLGENKICKLKDQISVINFTRVITGYDAVVKKI